MSIADPNKTILTAICSGDQSNLSFPDPGEARDKVLQPRVFTLNLKHKSIHSLIVQHLAAATGHK